MAITFGPNLGLAVNGALAESHYTQLMAQWRGLDALVQCNVLSATTTAQPGSPSDGDTYIVPTGATGASWSGKDGKIARYSTVATAWEYYTPKRGWVARSRANDGEYYFDGSDWILGYITTSTGLHFPGTTTKLGTDADGEDVAADDHTFELPLSTGEAEPAKFRIRVGTQGSSGTDPQTLVDALVLGEIANATSREVTLWNPAGTVMGKIEATVHASWLLANTGGRFGDRTIVLRASDTAATAPEYSSIRARGTLAAPTQVLNGDRIWQFSPRAFDGVGGTQQIGRLVFTATGDITDTSNPAKFGITVGRAGSTNLSVVAEFQAASGSIAEWVSPLTTLRFIPATSGSFAWRRPANDADTMTLSGDGTTVTFPLATAFVIGTDPGGSSPFRLGGNARINGDVYLSTSNGSLRKSSTNGTNGVYGGDQLATGANVRVYGGSHATQANDIEFLSGSDVRAQWDHSLLSWIFGGGAGDASALVALNSTSQGFLPPRMTETQRDAISSPADGLIIYNTTTGKFNGREGGAWVAFT